MTDFSTAREFGHFIKALGFRVFIAKNDGPRGYGFITNADGSRVVSFSMDTGTLGGNYGPPSRASGTGWQLAGSIWSLKTRADVERALAENPPSWIRKYDGRNRDSGWQYFTTLEQHLGMYGSSSGYREL